MVRETVLAPDDFIYPLFVTSGSDVCEPLRAIPGANLLSGARLAEQARSLWGVGVPAVLLFAVLEAGEKDRAASRAYSHDGPVQEAIRVIKNAVPEMIVIADLCLCEYTLDGHCGLLRGNTIDNDLTLECLQRAAASLATEGADVIAPSGMMDGTVQALRLVLDGEGFDQVMLMAYSAKYASGLYGPFKSATNSAPAESRHATHQLDVANSRQALEEIRLDVEEGADMVIVKPALGYLDIVAKSRERFPLPIAAYNVSGEYNMILGLAGGDDAYRCRIMLEMLTCIRRAGADMIITYFAADAARALQAVRH